MNDTTVLAGTPSSAAGARYRAVNTSLANKIGRTAWATCYWTLFRFSPRPLFGWRRWLLRCFGARIGPGTRIYGSARIWAPWNLVCEDHVAVGPGAEIYNADRVTLRSHAVVSQGSYLCGATHDFEAADFPMIWAPIEVGRYAWVAARATVQMGVKVGDGAVLGLGALATRDLDPWTVYAGVPARAIRPRRLRYAE
jgi:putative colanic acid biosynthesis acetyltransferase WcaF